MIKKRYIDRLLDALQYEANKLFIKQGEVDIAFKKETEENKDIENLIKRIELDTQVGDYRVVINYELKIVEIFKGNKLEVMTNFGKYGVTGLWTIVLEELENNGDIINAETGEFIEEATEDNKSPKKQINDDTMVQGLFENNK